MRGAGLQGARQAAVQVLQSIERRDLETESGTLCSVWTYSHDAVPIGLNRRAAELSDLPLRGHGPGLLGHALRTIGTTSAEHIRAARLRAPRRRDFRAKVRTIVIGRILMPPLHLTDPAALGELSLVRIDDTAQAVIRTPPGIEPFNRIFVASELSPNDLDEMLEP